MLWTVDGFPKVANGLSGFTPARQVALAITSLAFPDRASVTALRQAGIRTVVVFGAEVAGTPWQAVTSRPVAGLGIRRVGTATSRCTSWRLLIRPQRRLDRGRARFGASASGERPSWCVVARPCRRHRAR
jgi:hypothetical protein